MIGNGGVTQSISLLSRSSLYRRVVGIFLRQYSWRACGGRRRDQQAATHRRPELDGVAEQARPCMPIPMMPKRMRRCSDHLPRQRNSAGFQKNRRAQPPARTAAPAVRLEKFAAGKIFFHDALLKKVKVQS